MTKVYNALRLHIASIHLAGFSTYPPGWVFDSNFSDFRSVSPFGWRHIAICDFVRQEGVGSSGFPSQETILTFNKTVVVYLSVLFRCQKFCQWLCKLLAKCGALPDVVQAIYCKHCQMWLNGPTQQEPQCDFDCSHVAVLVRNALKE